MDSEELVRREEHLQFCKDRALKILEDGGKPDDAWASFLSDMNNDDTTRNHSALELGMMLIMGGHLSTSAAMKKHIEEYA